MSSPRPIERRIVKMYVRRSLSDMAQFYSDNLAQERERDRLTAGQPDQIYGLASTFESAAREAASASEAGARASLATGEAYRVDGGEVHALDLETGRTRELLSGSSAPSSSRRRPTRGCSAGPTRPRRWSRDPATGGALGSVTHTVTMARVSDG